MVRYIVTQKTLLVGYAGSGDVFLTSNDVDTLLGPGSSEISEPALHLDVSTLPDGSAIRVVDLPDDALLPENYSTVSLRSLFAQLDEEAFWTAARACHLTHWERTHRYCGVCGTEMLRAASELARRCERCGNSVYPRISPAIITAVIRDGRLLLAHNAQRKHSFYSVIAGFVEPGETLEQCVEREVYEETSIRVGNIRYMASQPWPFPDSLMLAFACDYVSGEIAVDGVEIDHAYWCPPDELPQVPPRPSVARRLIDWFVREYGAE